MHSSELQQAIQECVALRTSPDTLLSLGSMRETLTALLARLERSDTRQALDPDFHIQDELTSLWEFARETYRQSPDPAIKESASAAYTAAVRLQWALAEHDIPFIPRKSGYEASSVEELEKVLDRIISEQ
jgi:hypothetical protein